MPFRPRFSNHAGPDLLWQNQTSRDAVFWIMSGAVFREAALVSPTVPDSEWEIAGTDDFDLDGQWDVLWQNRTTG